MSKHTTVIFGATSEAGVELARLLKEDGQHVIGMVRDKSDTSTLDKLDIELRSADARDSESLRAVLSDIEPRGAFVSLIGGRDDNDRLDDSLGNINAIEAARARSAQRFVLITSVGCGGTLGIISEDVRDEYKYILGEKNKAEEHLKCSDLSWTIVRPGGLSVPKPLGLPILVEDDMVMGNIHRVDLAHIIYRVLKSNKAAGKIWTTVDATDCYHAKGSEIVPVAI